MTSGIYISPTQYVSFADQVEKPLAGQIATRMAAGDLTSFFGLLPNPDPVLKAMGQDIAVYRNLLADPLIKGIRRRRIAAVLAMERGFEQEASNTPARVRKACEQAIDRHLDVQSQIRAMMDGAFFGYRVLEHDWRYLDGQQIPVPIAKPSEWFGFDADTGALLFKPRHQAQGVAVPARKFIVVGKMRSWENPYGEPDLAPCFWPVTFKRGGLKFWVTFTEKYGMPWAIGKLPRGTQQAEMDDFAARLMQMVRDAVAVVPDDGSVDLKSVASTTNADLYEKLLMFCRSEINIALLGNNQSVEKESNKASATAAGEVEEDLQDDDAQMVADGINQWVRDYCAVNFPGAEPPIYQFWRQEQVDDVRARRDETLTRAGARFTQSYFLRTYNLEDGDLHNPDEGTADAGAPALPPSASASFADADDTVDADLRGDGQAALDGAIDLLDADVAHAAMRTLLQPALDAIAAAATPEQVQQALLDAWPHMDASALQELLAQAFFVADLAGMDAAREGQA